MYQVLEKMRPIDQKLKYQVDKVIAIAATGGQGMSTIYKMPMYYVLIKIKFILTEHNEMKRCQF